MPVTKIASPLKSDENCDVLIVGGGIAGLTTAREIKRHEPNLKVLVIEAKNRVGGRTNTIELKTAGNTTDKFDLGGQWVGITQTYILNTLKELNLETYEQYTDGKKWLQMGHDKPWTYEGSLPTATDFYNQYSAFEMADIMRAYPIIKKLVDSVDLKNPMNTPNVKQLDALTVEEWARQNGQTRFFQDLCEGSTMVAYGVRAMSMSMLYYLYYAKAAGSVDNLLETTDTGAQRFRVKGGTLQISQKLAHAIGNENVRLNRALLQLHMNENAGTVTAVIQDLTNLKNISIITAKRVVMAIPPSECGKIRFTPALPFEKKMLFDGAPQGNLMKFIATYETTFWRSKGFSGEIMACGGGGKSDGELTPLVDVYDGTNHLGKPAIVGFVNNNVFGPHESFEDRKQRILKDLARYFGDEVLHPTDYIDKDWHEEPFSPGCPVSVIPAGNMGAFAHIREPFSLIHFAGTESATHWTGYMSGAVQSGLRAAHEILHNFKSKHVNFEHLKDSIYDPKYQRPKDWDFTYPSKHTSKL
jgi:monoamine oxidase